MEQTSASRLQEQVEIIRPAAVLESRVATQVLNHLRDQDVSLGGVWNASASVWQRYDVPWNGVGGTRGTSVLLGTVAVMYDTPVRNEVTIYRVTVTPAGGDLGWTVDALCDDALVAGGLTLASCPRAEISNAPKSDPFKSRGSGA